MAFIVHIYESRAGQMGKDISSMYRIQPTKHLMEMRSKKYVRLQKLMTSQSWFDRKEREMLESTIKQIDVELACRIHLPALL